MGQYGRFWVRHVLSITHLFCSLVFWPILSPFFFKLALHPPGSDSNTAMLLGKEYIIRGASAGASDQYQPAWRFVLLAVAGSQFDWTTIFSENVIRTLGHPIKNKDAVPAVRCHICTHT